MNLLLTFLFILVVALIPLVLYAMTKTKKKFDLLEWIYQSGPRLILGVVLIFLVSVLVTYVPEAETVLTAIGFNPDKSTAGIGLAIGGLLVAGVRGKN